MNQRTTRTQMDRSIGACSVLDDYESCEELSLEITETEAIETIELEIMETMHDMSHDMSHINTTENVGNDVRNLRARSVTRESIQPNRYNYVELPQVARMADRYEVSDQTAAAIATATLIDFGIVSMNDQTFVIDRNKIRRHRRNYVKLKRKTWNLEISKVYILMGEKTQPTFM